MLTFKLPFSGSSQNTVTHQNYCSGNKVYSYSIDVVEEIRLKTAGVFL